VKSLLLLCLCAACSTTEDRPATLAYVTETILVPYCASAECHSSGHQQSNYVFDTVANAQKSLAGMYGVGGTLGALIVQCTTPPPNCTDAAGQSILAGLVGRDPSFKDSAGHWMPLDQPLPNKDVFFIGTWINDGAPGYVFP
jgi:hypothetical protein